MDQKRLKSFWYRMQKREGGSLALLLFSCYNGIKEVEINNKEACFMRHEPYRARKFNKNTYVVDIGAVCYPYLLLGEEKAQ